MRKETVADRIIDIAATSRSTCFLFCDESFRSRRALGEFTVDRFPNNIKGTRVGGGCRVCDESLCRKTAPGQGFINFPRDSLGKARSDYPIDGLCRFRGMKLSDRRLIDLVADDESLFRQIFLILELYLQ